MKWYFEDIIKSSKTTKQVEKMLEYKSKPRFSKSILYRPGGY